MSLYLSTARPGCWWPIGEVTGKFDGLGRFTEGFVQTLWTFLLLPKGPFCVIHRVVYTIAGIVVHVNIVQGEIPIPTGDNDAMSYACVHVRIECFPKLMLLPRLNAETEFFNRTELPTLEKFIPSDAE